MQSNLNMALLQYVQVCPKETLVVNIVFLCKYFWKCLEIIALFLVAQSHVGLSI